MNPKRWLWVALLLVSLSALAVGWRPLGATLWVNAGGLCLDRALLSGTGPDLLEQARACSLRALALQPGDARAVRQLVRVARAQGIDPRQVGLSQQMLAATKDPLTLFQLGFIALDRGDRIGAIAIWQQVPTAERYFMNAGMVDYAAGRVTQALEFYALSDAIDGAVDPRKKWMYADLCQAYSVRGPLAEGVSWCERAAQVEGSVWNLIYLGRAYLWHDQPEKALEVLLCARQMRPNAPGTYLYLGRTYETLGQWLAAQEAYSRGAALSPAWGDMHLGLAEVSRRLGDAPAAYCAYERAIRHAASPEQAQRAREAQNALRLSPVPVCEDLP
jgi:tetratricopeptide (TPR) repeat protein